MVKEKYDEVLQLDALDGFLSLLHFIKEKQFHRSCLSPVATNTHFLEEDAC